MRISHATILGAILLSLATLKHTSYQASAAPVPRPVKKYTHFPYRVTGPAPTSLYRPGQVLDSCVKSNSYAISFDDGPGQLTDELLDYLDEQRLKVTFFMNGDNWNCIYGSESKRLLKRAFKSQHQIAAHPWSHRDFEVLSDDEIRQEMFKIEDAFRNILGVVPRYMRPPYGEHSKRVRKIMEEMGYLMILWDVDQLEADAHESLGTVEHDNACDMGDNEMSQGDDEGGREDEVKVLASSSHKRQTQTLFSSKWAEAVRGVPHMALDRDAMVMGGIYQETTSLWAVEYVQSLGYDVMPVGACVGETDPRLWYKEIVEPADEATLPQSCYI